MNGYERVEKGKEYFFINILGDVSMYKEEKNNVDNDLYANANYYSNKTVAENNARADMLMRKLRRFAAENNEHELDWKDKRLKKYEICFDYVENTLCVSDYSSVRSFGQIYFTSEEIAKQAINDFYDELFWYFTEYCDMEDNKIEEKYGCELCSNGNLANVGINDNRIALWGGNNKPDSNQKLKYCPNCGRKLED